MKSYSDDLPNGSKEAIQCVHEDVTRIKNEVTSVSESIIDVKAENLTAQRSIMSLIAMLQQDNKLLNKNMTIVAGLALFNLLGTLCLITHLVG